MMITTKHPLAINRQCHLLAVPRWSAYTRRRGVSAADLKMMRELDALYLRWPFYGRWRLRVDLQHRGYRENQKRVQRFMRLLRLQTLFPRLRTSQPGKGHKTNSYLLNGRNIERRIGAGQVIFAICRWQMGACF